MDLENFEGASTLLCIDFLKIWGASGPPGPPGSGGPAREKNKAEHAVQSNITGKGCIILLSNVK